MKDRTSESVKNRKAIDQCKDSYDELKDSMEEHAKERKESIKSAKTEAATYQNLADKLYELADKTNKTASDKAQMNTIVDQLNGAMPKLGLSIDETTGALNREKSAVDAVIDSMKQQALANAYQEQANKAASDLAEAQIQLSEAEEVLNDLRSQAVKKINEHNAAVQDGTESVQEMASSYAAAGEPVDKYALQLNALNGQIKEQEEVVAGLQGTTSEADERYNKIAEKAYEYKTAVEESNQGVSDSATEMSDEVKQAYEDMKTSIQNSLEGATDAFKKFSGGEEIDKGKIIENLESQAKGVEEWGQNLKALAGRAGEGMTKELYDYLVKLGPQSANLVKSFTQMTSDELQDAATAFSQAGGELSEGITSELATASANWENAGQEIAQKAGEAGEKSGKEHTEKAKSGIESGQKEVTEAAKKGGEEAGKVSQKATADGIQQNSGQVSQAASSSIRKAEDAALGYYNGFYNVGANLMRGTVAGMTANSPAVEEAARAAVRNAVTGAKKEGNIKSPSRVMRDEVGEMLAAGMAVGIDEGSGDVEKSARDLAKVSVDATKDELGIHSPSKVFKNKIGKNIVSGVIKGIEAEVPKLKKTMKKMSEEAVKAAGEVDAAKGGYSDAASAIMESITSGLDKRQELLVSKLDNKIDGYVDKVVKKYEKLAEDKKTEAGNTTDATQKKKLQEEAKKFRKNAKKIKNYANKYTSTFMDALKEGTEKAYSKIEDDLDKKLDGIADKYQKAYDKIISFRDDMKKKMSEPANMYDLDTQLTQVERYQEGLKKLKDKIPESLMDQILGMDLNEADNFVEHLNAMSAEELAAYKEKWEQLQSSSKTFSKDFFEQRLTDVKAGWTKEVEEAAKTAQEAAEEAGKKIAKSLIKSLNGEKETLKKSMRGIAKDMIEAFKKAFGLGKDGKKAEGSKTTAEAKGTGTAASGKTSAKKKKTTAKNKKEEKEWQVYRETKEYEKARKKIEQGTQAEMQAVMAEVERMQNTIASLESMGASPTVNVSSPQISLANNQPVQLQAEIHTTVDLDGRTVGKAVTPYVNENMNTIWNRQRRGS